MMGEVGIAWIEHHKFFNRDIPQENARVAIERYLA